MSETPWYRADPSLLARTVQEVRAVQPGLLLVDQDGRVRFRGRYDIRAEDRVCESFELEITLPTESERHLPTVREIGGRIPHQMDPHHVNPENPVLCVQLEEAYWYDHPEGLSLQEFLEGPLRAHLAGQVEVLAGGEWPQGEWAHGDKGRMQFYREVLDTSGPEALVDLLDAACEPVTKTYRPCPCGRGRKFRKCHMVLLKALREAPTFQWVVENRARLKDLAAQLGEADD